MRYRARVFSLVLLTSASFTACGPAPDTEPAAGEQVEPVASQSAALATSTDRRFGFIGDGSKSFAHTFGTESYLLIGNENNPSQPRVIDALTPAFDPLPGEHVVFRVGTFNARQDGFGQTINTFAASIRTFAKRRGEFYANPFAITRPSYTWFRPNVDAVAQIEIPLIIDAIRRWHTKGIRDFDVSFEIGNEPNYFVSLTPADYARLFATYYRAIKKEAPAIRVAMGALFAFELMPQDSRDYIGSLITLKGEQETNAATNANLSWGTEAGPFLLTLGGSAVATLLLDLWGSYAGERATRDTKNLLFDRFFNRTSKQYLSEVFDNLPSDIAPDVVSFHAYPADFKTRLAPSDISNTIDKVANDLRLLAYQKRSSLYPLPPCSGDVCPLTGGPEVWITELGNINPYLNEATLGNRTQYVADHLASSSTVDAWFWYKPVGQDGQFDLVKDDPAVGVPLTRLVSEPSYGTSQPLPTYPAVIPCSALNALGNAYYYAATGSPCGWSAGPGFFTHFEGTDIEPVWTALRMQKNATSSYSIGAMPGTTQRGLLLRGTDSSTSQSYSYENVYQVHIPVTPGLVLQYSVNPSDARSKAVGVDLWFTDGTALRDSGSVDQWGYNVHPASRASNPNIATGTLSYVDVDLYARNAGKTIDRVVVAYDQPAQTGAFSAWFGSIYIGRGS
jgi:hypothetical protein